VTDPVPNSLHEMLVLAFAIADDQAASEIECGCDPTTDADHRRWYDVSTSDEIDTPDVERAVRYLTLRGQLQRHPRVPSLVALNARAITTVPIQAPSSPQESPMSQQQIALGQTYRDTATGYTGTCTAVCNYLHGSTAVRIETAAADGSTLSSQWIESGRLEVAQST
jgi:hypothetical protein